jgi:hypothetical protein
MPAPLVFIRPATKEDAPTFIQWAVATKGNEFDPEAPQYPDSFTLCAYDLNGPVAYMPVQQPMYTEPLFLDSMAIRPGADNRLVATALKELIQACVTIGHMKQTGEIYFLGTNEETNKFAENTIFEKLPWPVYRLRLSDLVKNEDSDKSSL